MATSAKSMFGNAVSQVLNSWTALQQFEEDMIDRTSQAVRLRPFAIPTIFDFPPHLQQLAVEHHFGGAESKEKAEWMVFAIETWFKDNDGIEPYEVEDFLEDVLNAEFDLKVEDNSIPEISQLICLFFRLCQENRVDDIQHRLQALPKLSLQSCQRGNEQMDDDDDLEENPSASSSLSSFSSQQHNTSTSSQSAASTSIVEDTEMSEEKTDEDGWQVINRGKRK